MLKAALPIAAGIAAQQLAATQFDSTFSSLPGGTTVWSAVAGVAAGMLVEHFVK